MDVKGWPAWNGMLINAKEYVLDSFSRHVEVQSLCFRVSDQQRTRGAMASSCGVAATQPACCISGGDEVVCARNRSWQTAECSAGFLLQRNRARKWLLSSRDVDCTIARLGKPWRCSMKRFRGVAKAILEVDAPQTGERKEESVRTLEIAKQPPSNGASVALDEQEAAESGNAEALASSSPETLGVELMQPEGHSETSITVVNPLPEKNVGERYVIRNDKEIFQERAFLVGVELKRKRSLFSFEESLNELAQLADTAGLAVVGSSYQKLGHPNPRTYIASGKVAEVKTAIEALDVETVILDDEISPGQLRNLEKAFGDKVRVCDRTALILDIFSQRAATREAALQVELARLEYQLPRLTKLWSHLERQAGGMVKGMGEKQIEVDKRILRDKIGELRKSLESVRDHRQQYRNRRASVPIPVISLVGYTNAGKSTLLNKLSNAGVLAEDRLFATLDPITRRVQLPNGKECLFTDTVGFIQKLPTQLVAAFRATLEEIADSSLILHAVDISHPMAKEQTKAVEQVLAELNVQHIPRISVFNKIDRAKDQDLLRAEARQQGAVCLSALTGEGMQEFFEAVENKLKDLLVYVEAVVPYGKGELVDMIHRHGVVEHEEYSASGTLIKAHVPLPLSKQLLEFRFQACATT